MSALFVEQLLNGLQFGLMLFLLAAGLTLVFGIMDMINLAHGSFYMLGAYLAASVALKTGAFWPAVLLGALGAGLIGAALELTVLRSLYQRDHLAQVLATFGLILIANEVVKIVWGAQPISLNPPPALSGAVEILPGLTYPAYRLVMLALGLVVAIALYVLVQKTKVGAWVRAGASNRDMARAMGVNVSALFTVVFGIGAALAGLAGALLGPLLSVQIGMGENILILAFVVVVVGGIGSIRGALVGAILIGVIDTAGRVLLPITFRHVLSPQVADNLGPALASMSIFVLMAAILFFKPAGLFPART